MSPTTLLQLEQAVRRYGDDLYRLALLLTPDPASAAAALLRMARRLAHSFPDPLDEQALIAALVAELPQERRRYLRRQAPAWVREAERPEDVRIRGLIAGLPREQRLALGLVVLRGLAPEQAAAVLGAEAAEVGVQLRDAFLALAPVALADVPSVTLVGADAPEACQPTRLALGLTAGQPLHLEAATRGHLALCAECRAVERHWQDLAATIRAALLGAMRELRLPVELADRMQAGLAPTPKEAQGGRTLREWLPRALVPLAVIALIALLVLPRAPQLATPQSGATTSIAAPEVLVRQAQANLYAVPPGEGLWHGRWEARWVFPDGAYALLDADLWADSRSGAHRVQLVHHDGGGPFEFELGAGAGDLWYAVSPSYARSIYPLISNDERARVHVQLDREAQAQMLRERLASGAWALPSTYLRLAQGAQSLRSWGRQVEPDGTAVEVIGFSGLSPLGMPPGAPDTSQDLMTILLSIDPASGTLREVRELAGPTGAEQVTRSIWRFVGEERLTDPGSAAAMLSLERAWNGVGTFADREGIASAAVPIYTTGEVISLPLLLSYQPPISLPLLLSYQQPIWLPEQAPAGTRAVLVFQVFDSDLTAVYLGDGWRLVVQTARASNAQQPPATGPIEVVKTADWEGRLRPTPAQRYEAELEVHGAVNTWPTLVRISASGYSHQAFADLLMTIHPLRLESYRRQADLVVGSEKTEPDARAALLAALEDARPPDGMARHMAGQIFIRHSPAPDPLPDPYHRPLYAGQPELMTWEMWLRSDERTLVMRRDGDREVTRSYVGPTGSWLHESSIDRLTLSQTWDVDPLSQRLSIQSVILNLLNCGGAHPVQLDNDTQVISASDVSWRTQPCQGSDYTGLLHSQLDAEANPASSFMINSTDNQPYLADVAQRDVEAPLTIVLTIRNGHATRATTWLGPGERGTLLEMLDVVEDELVPADRVPAGAFTAQPPAAQLVNDYNQATNDLVPTPQPRSIDEARAQIGSPVFDLPAGPPILRRYISGLTAGPTSNGYAPDAMLGPLYGAVWRGFALSFNFTVETEASQRLMRVFQGSADRFGAYLRSNARWRASAPIEVSIAGRTVAGWRVEFEDGVWVLAEIDGTLLAIEAGQPFMEEQIPRLTPLAAS